MLAARRQICWSAWKNTSSRNDEYVAEKAVVLDECTLPKKLALECSDIKTTNEIVARGV